MSAIRHPAIIWTNVVLLSMGPLGTNFGENLLETKTYSLTENALERASVKHKPFCPGFECVKFTHDDVIKWKHFPLCWPFVRGIHRSPVNSPHKGQWRVTLMFYLICARINCWVNNREAGDLIRHRAHYDVIVMRWKIKILISAALPSSVERTMIIWRRVLGWIDDELLKMILET